VKLVQKLQEQRGGEGTNRECPRCHSKRIWKSGVRENKRIPDTQRYECRDCDYRFSESPILSINSSNRGGCRVGAILTEAKNLTEVEPLRDRLAGATKRDKEARSTVVEYLWYLRKKGLKQSTITHYGKRLQRLMNLGVKLLNPEEVKGYLANNSTWSERTKAICVTIYDGFTKFRGITWDAPRYKAVKKIPFLPLETEIDQFICACGRKLATFLQVLKETGMRCGEAKQLDWIDIDFQRRLVSITPEKGSNPRILPISLKLIAMLKNLPQESTKVFKATLGSIKANLYITRKTVARKLGNPRLLKIKFHTLRHWKGTMKYHKTKDILHVQQVLGHRDIKSTMIYIHLEHALFITSNDEFHVKTATTVTEACKLVEVGFEYITTMDKVQVYRKRK